MALASWKTFDFFDISPVVFPEDDDRKLFENNEISCTCSGSGSLFVGGQDGAVRIVSPSFKIVRTFQAHETGQITQMKQIEGTALLVTVAEDLSNEPVLKVWSLDKPVKKTGLPTCLSEVRIRNGQKAFPISAFTALDDLSQVAIGFANGSVTLVRGDLIHERGTKQRIVHDSEEPITGLEFREEARLTTLYVATTSRILKLVITGRGQGQPARALDDMGCAVDCMTVDRGNGDIIVAREDAIYYYTVDGRGPCYGYDGPKSMVALYKGYVVLVCPPTTKASASKAATRRFSTQTDDIFDTSTLAILDTDLKYIAHSQSLVSQVKDIFILRDELYLRTLDGKILRYREKSLQQRLDILYQRNLFSVAINLAQKRGMDRQEQNVIFRKYGDFLYQKAEYDAAMQQYLKAIENTEPSQVIRKFLDTQRIHNLIEYLEELHDHHKATADHTTLLLNCYAKLKDVQKLERFIKSPGDLKFDLETAIAMCRQGGYYDQAAYLATKHGEHELVVDILIEDAKQYSDALDFIWRLEPTDAHSDLMKYARVLLEHCPQDTTKLFIEYYSGKYQPKAEVQPAPEVEASTPALGYAADAAAGAVNAVRNLQNLIPLPYMNASPAPTPAAPGNNVGLPSVEGTAHAPVTIVSSPKYDPPRPRTAFSSFIDHPDEFITFLEACLKEAEVQPGDGSDLSTALFEMYLYKARTKSTADREAWEAKATALISNPLHHIDPSNVLLLSHLSSFGTGTTLVREQAGLRFDIFRSYTAAKDTAGAIKALRKYGPAEPRLYPAALAYFTSDSRVLQEAGDELNVVLEKIDADGLMAPLQVIQTLSSNACATMGIIKPYLLATIERERRDIASNRRLIQSYRRETEAKRQEITELTSKPQTFNNTRCSDCGAPLSLPTIHFLCKHSFHQKCLNVTVRRASRGGSADEDVVEGDCPLCKRDLETIRAMRRQQVESAEKGDLFQEALARGRDGFKTISEWFGRGVMSVNLINRG